MTTLYHGSNMGIEEIDLKRGRKGKDFGQGFYLSADLAQAQRLAQITVEREGFGTPTVTSFRFDENKLKNSNINYKIFDVYTTDWAEFIVANRLNRTDTPIHNYDIVYGPIANDRVGVQVQRFMQHYIDAKRLVEELKYINPTFQYFFGTERAIALLQKI